MSNRHDWLDAVEKIAGPVLDAASRGKLSHELPDRADLDPQPPGKWTEAFCRTLVGVAPFLQLDEATDEREDTLRAKWREQVTAAMAFVTDFDHSDTLNTEKARRLVETAFFAHALLRAPRIVEALDDATRTRLFDTLRNAREFPANRSNWLFFSAIVEAALAHFGEDFDLMRIRYALDMHQVWYKGDGVYGDGPWLHHDYYNSFVIQPMMMDVLDVVVRVVGDDVPMHEKVATRFTRYAEVQERMISPEGTYPPVGRSLAYRFGAFQHLAQAALQHRLPDTLQPAQVREGLHAVIRRSLDAPGTFDEEGWLNVGVAGNQPSLGEGYISRGSPYLCCSAFLPLGLPPSDPFWADPDAPWTAKRVWAGEQVALDHALHDGKPH